MTDYPSLLGKLSSSSAIVFVPCGGCAEWHEHEATADLLAGKKVLMAAKCAPTIATESGRVEANRSAYRGSYYYVSLR